MRQHTNPWLVALGLAFAAPCRDARAQLPERTRTPTPMPSDPTMAPPLPVTEPRVVEQPAVARPGTILREPVAAPTREIGYLQPGEPPANVQVTETGPRTVTLSWTAPAGAIGFWVHQAGAGQATYYRGGSMATEPTAMVTRLLPATAYSFKVSAVYPQEMQRREGISEPISATTAGAPAPGGLTASIVGRGQVHLTWDGLPGADGFQLVRNDSTVKDFRPVNTSGVPGTLPTTFDDALLPGTHRYQLKAVYLAEGAEAVSAAAPTPAVSVMIAASTRVRYCQARSASAACAVPGARATVVAAAATMHRNGRLSP